MIDDGELPADWIRAAFVPIICEGPLTEQERFYREYSWKAEFDPYSNCRATQHYRLWATASFRRRTALFRASLYPPPEAVRAWRRVSIRLTCGRSPYLNRSMCRPPSEADATGGHELYHREANRDTAKTPAPRTCSRRGLLARGIGSDRLAWHALNLESSSCFVRSASHLPWSSCPRSRPRAELGADPHRVISSHYGKCPTIAIWPWLDAVSAVRWRGPLPARRH